MLRLAGGGAEVAEVIEINQSCAPDEQAPPASRVMAAAFVSYEIGDRPAAILG